MSGQWSGRTSRVVVGVVAVLLLIFGVGSLAGMTISHGPRIGLVTGTTATIAWDTDTAAVGSVKWGPTTGYGSILSESSSVTNHRVTITGLAAATTYHYQVVTGTVSSADYTFTTAVPAGTDFTFVSMADSRGNSASADLAGLPAAFTNIIAKEVVAHPAFALFGGDMFYGSSTQATQQQLYDVFKAAIDPLAHTTSFLIAVGNHEMNTTSFSTINQFNQNFAQPQTGPSGYPGTVFAFDWGNSHFAVVDTSHVSSSCGGTNNCMYYMFDDMLTWLDSDLASAQSRGVRHIFVMGHSHAYADSSWTLNYMGNYPTQRDKFWTILANRKVDAYICGHIHSFDRALGQQGVVQWLNGNSGAGTGPFAYTVWSIHGDTATATLYDDSGAQVDQLAIQSSQPGTCTTPTASVTSPTAGATVSGSVTLTASVTGSPTPTQVKFMVDGSVVGTVTASPWSLPWTSTAVSNGSHTITASATNTCGTGTSTGVSVTVNNPTATYSISGTITLSGAGLAGVSVTTGSASATTSSSGAYTIAGLANGTYTVTPTLAGYTFAPINQSVTISGANVTGKNFTATSTATYSISGTITLSGAGLAGVAVSTGSASATTNSSGAFTLASLANGTYTVTPTLTGYTFSPTNQSVTISGANVTGKNFTAAVVSGPTTLLSDGFESTGWSTAQVSGTAGTWTMAANGSHPSASPHGGSKLADFNSYTSASGSQTRLYRTSGLAIASSYSSASLAFWMYHDSGYSTTNDRVQPTVSTNGSTWANVGTAISRYSATAGWVQHTVDVSSYVGQASVQIGFVGISAYGNDCYLDDVTVVASGAAPTTYSISGTITLSGSGLSGVRVSTGTASATTNSSGVYMISSLANGSYTVTPSLSGYTFSPTSQSVTISGANVTGATFTATPAASCGAKAVISQVYGGGGNSGAYYANDFVELFNRGDTAQSLTGWSVQYASATGTTWSVTTLAGSIPAGGYYLVQLASSGSGTALPTADATGTVNMSGTSGKVALVSSTTALSGSCPSGATIADLVGYGTANCYEGATAAPTLANTTAAVRANAGCTDTNVNGSDFTAVTSNATNPPRNSSTAHHTCTCQ